MMSAHASIKNWIDEKDLHQCQFIKRKVLSLCRGLQCMNAWTGGFECSDDYAFSRGAMIQLEDNNEQIIIKKIKADWSSKKYDLEKEKTHKRRSVLLEKEVNRKLNELTVFNNFESIHQTMESLILDNYGQINTKINEEKERKKIAKAEAAKSKIQLFRDKEQTKRLNSAYIRITEHNHLKQEQAGTESLLKKALYEITYLKEKLASKELSIDNHLSKICNFVAKLDAIEPTLPAHKKENEVQGVVDVPVNETNTCKQLSELVVK